MVDSYSKTKKPIRNVCDPLEKTFQTFNHASQQKSTMFPSFEINNDFVGKELTPGVYELGAFNTATKRKISDSGFKLNIEAVTISMKSVLTT